MPDVTDVSMRVTEAALAGLEARQDVRANNIANVNTPGFAAQTVDFESALADAVATGRVDARTVGGATLQPVMSIQNGQGNTVDLEGEMAAMVKDNLTRSGLVNHYNAKVRMMRAAMSGS